MAWYNITCRSGGSNMNAGCTDGVGECATATVLTNTNGAWDNTTGVFTCSGAPDLSGLTVGHRVSLAFDADTTPTTNQYLTGTISAFDNGAKTITLTNRAALGTLSTAASGITARVGGAFLGPNGSSPFPFNLLFTQATGNPLRFNLKNDQTYNITANVNHAQNTARIQGYTTDFGDGGKFILDGGTSGASYILLTLATASSELYDAELRNNGATGNAAGLSVTGALCDLFRVTVHDVRGNGVSISSARVTQTEVRAYNCNQSNNGTSGGFGGNVSVPMLLVRCVSHDNTGSNSGGFMLNAASSLLAFRDCIADSNTSVGFYTSSTSAPTVFTGCDAYGNGSHGINGVGASGTKPVFATDCNFVANGGYGVNLAGGTAYANGRIQNCGFGSGTAANTSGATNALGDTVVESSVTYDANATPWADPANGDFTVALTAAKGTGTGLAFSPTVSYPDRAAAQGAAA